MKLNPKIQELIQKKDFGGAQRLLEKLLAQEPENADAYYLLGVNAYFQGKVGPTLKALKKSLELEPRHTDAAICLSVLLNDLGKYEEAKKVFEQANHSISYRKEGLVTDVDQKFAVKHLELGDLYFRYRRYDEAIEEYTKASLLNPQYLESRIRRAKAHARKGYVSRALQDLQQLRSEHPHYLAARIQLGLLHYSQQNFIDAEVEWAQVLKLDPSNRECQGYLESLKKQSRVNRDYKERPRHSAL